VFEIQHLLSGELSSAHISRLVFYADAQLDVTTEIKDHVELVESQGLFEMERLVRVRRSDDKLEALVAWAGFEEAEWTWEPLDHLLHDRREFVTKQLGQLKLSKVIRLALKDTYQIRV
jgi:hypothetical protein